MKGVFAMVMVLALGTACGASTHETTPHHSGEHHADGVQYGKASWYGHADRLASGERFDPDKLTAAHRSLKFGTRVRVTNRKNGKSVVVRINDRGPYGRGRVIDVSKAAAQRLGMIDDGVVAVKLEVLGR